MPIDSRLETCKKMRSLFLLINQTREGVVKMRRVAGALAALFLAAQPAAALDKVFYGGNGTVVVDSGLPNVGVIHGVAPNGDLLWYRYLGMGAPDPTASKDWDRNSGNPIGNGWGDFQTLLGAGDGVILAIKPNGDLHWYRYTGLGEADRTARTGWDKNSGNVIGNGWAGFRHVFVGPRQGRRSESHITIYAVNQAGDLLWYGYDGDGTADRSGRTGWMPNSGNAIGNGWGDFRSITSSGSTIYAITQGGDLLWYRYSGRGESDRSGSTGWAANSGNPIGNGWQTFCTVVASANDRDGFADVLYAIETDGDLLWYRYVGQGEADRSARTGWAAGSGNQIGVGW